MGDYYDDSDDVVNIEMPEEFDNGEIFRDHTLAPILKDNKTVVINFDESVEYDSYFLEEVFGGLILNGLDPDLVLTNLVLRSYNRDLLFEIQEYIDDATDYIT